MKIFIEFVSMANSEASSKSCFVKKQLEVFFFVLDRKFSLDMKF